MTDLLEWATGGSVGLSRHVEILGTEGKLPGLHRAYYRVSVALLIATSLVKAVGGQRPTEHEIQRERIKRAIESISRSADRRATETVEHLLMPSDGRWDRNTAEKKVSDSLRAGRIAFSIDAKAAVPFEAEAPPPRKNALTIQLKSLALPEDLDFPLSELSRTTGRSSADHQRNARRLAAADIVAKTFVAQIISTVRLESVLDQISKAPQGAVPQSLGSEQLQSFLVSRNVHDAEQVAKSFDVTFVNAHVFGLPEPTTLLRLSGGTTLASGRFYSCCIWDALSLPPGEAPAPRWSDASGLALPPGNTMERLHAVTLPRGTLVVVGVINDNFANAFGERMQGGGTQILVPDPIANPSVIDFVRAAHGGSDATDVGIWINERFIRFRAASQAAPGTHR